MATKPTLNPSLETYVANQAAYPMNPAPATLASVITLSSDKLASYAANGLTAGFVAGEHAVLFGADFKPLASNAQAATAKYAVWCNVATRSKAESKLATAIREAAGVKGEVKLPTDAGKRADFIGKLAKALADGKLWPVAQATTAKVEQPATAKVATKVEQLN